MSNNLTERINNNPSDVIKAFLEYGGNEYIAEGGIAKPTKGVRGYPYPIPTHGQASRLNGEVLMSEWVQMPPVDFSEVIASHLGDGQPEQSSTNTAMVADTQRAVASITKSHRPVSNLLIDALGLPEYNLGGVGSRTSCSIDEICDADLPDTHVIPRQELLGNIKQGLSGLGLEIELDQIEKMPPKTLGFMILLASNADISCKITSNGYLSIKAGVNREKGRRIPVELAFRHIGPGMRVINSALISYILFQEKISKLPIDLPIGDNLKMAQLISSGDFQRTLNKYAETVVSKEELTIYDKAVIANLEAESSVMLEQSRALRDLEKLINRKQSYEREQPSKKIDNEIQALEVSELERRIQNIQVPPIDGEKWYVTLSRKQDAQASLEQRISILREKQREIAPIDVAAELESLVLQFFDYPQHDLVKKVLSSTSHRGAKGDEALVFNKIKKLFGGVWEDVVLACSDSGMLPTLTEVEKAQEANDLWFNHADHDIFSIQQIDQKIAEKENVELFLDLLK